MTVAATVATGQCQFRPNVLLALANGSPKFVNLGIRKAIVFDTTMIVALFVVVCL